MQDKDKNTIIGEEPVQQFEFAFCYKSDHDNEDLTEAYLVPDNDDGDLQPPRVNPEEESLLAQSEIDCQRYRNEAFLESTQGQEVIR